MNDTDKVKEQHVQKSVNPHQQISKLKVLIVDDEAKVRDMLYAMLTRLGYECRTTTNSREALCILEEDHFSIVISDVRMPGMDGIELLKQIKERWPDTDVMCMTGYSKEYTFSDAVKAGANDFILKPFSKDEMEAKLNRIVQERKLRSDIINSRNKVRAILDGIKEGIYFIDHDFRIIAANKALAESVGLSVKDVIGKRCYELIHKQNTSCEGDDLICPAKRSFDTGLVSTAIHKHFKANNEECYVEITATSSTVYGGKTKQTILVSRDITKRRHMEEKVRKTKDYLDNVIESSLDCIVMGGNTGPGHIIRVNQSFLKLLGYEKEEVIGRHIAEFAPLEVGTYKSTTGELIEIGEEFFNEAKEMTKKLFEEGKIYNWESYYLRKDRKIVPVEMNIVFLYDREGNITGSVGINRNISKRRKIEIENTSLLEETKNALEELKKTQSYLLQNEKMASIGQLAAGVAHEINNPTGFVHSNLGSLNKYSSKVLELIRRYEEGLAALKNNGGEGVASFCEEIEELKKKLKIDFIMRDFQKVISDSLEGTQRIKKIVADLKSFSRVDQAEFKHADVNEGLKSTLNVVWNELKYKCMVEKDYGDLPQIHCNLGHLNQVFMNILVNAAQAIEDKGTIKISTRYVNGQSGGGDTRKDYIEIEISDTGSGIPEEKLNRIFEPFFTTKQVGKGTGLGLSIVYDIIQKHKGEIKVESEVGKGTTFTIQLPILEEEAS